MVLSNDMKKAIAFGLIIGAIISICNMCFASDVVTVPELLIGTNGVFVDAPGSSGGLKYVEVHKGDVVRCTANVSFFVCTSSDEPSAGVSFDFLAPSAVQNYTYVATTNGIFVVCGTGNSAYTSIDIVVNNGLNGFIAMLASAISFINLNNILNNVVPIIAISVLLGLGFYLLKRLLNRIKRAKGGV